MTIRQLLVKLFGEAFKKAVKVSPIPSPVPSPTPAPDKPATGPLAVPLVPIHGADEAAIDAWLAAGGAPECDGGIPQVRFQLLRPSGKSWSYAPFRSSGCVASYADGKLVIKDVEFEGQLYRLVYQSHHDQGLHMPGLAVKAGDTLDLNNGKWLFFECRNKQ